MSTNANAYACNKKRWLESVNTTLTLKEPGGGIRPPQHFLLYLSRLFFFVLKIYDFFSSSLVLDLRPFFKKSDLGLQCGIA